MYDAYKPIYQALTEYLVSFEKNGYDKAAADNILSLLSKLEDTPMSDIFRKFGAQDIERAAVALGTLADISRRAAEIVYRVFGVRAGSITPEAVCELFCGVSDILPISEYLYEDLSVPGMIFDGVRPSFNAVMTLKPFAAGFIIDGDIDDEAFLPDEHNVTEHIVLSENSRAERELRAALSTRVISSGRIIAVRGEEGSGRRTAVRRVLEAERLLKTEIRTDLNYDRARMKELAVKLRLIDAVPVAVQSKSTDAMSFSRFVGVLSELVGTVIAVCDADTPELTAAAEVVTVKIGQPSSAEQYRIWENEIKQYSTDSTVDISELTGEFDLNAGGIKKAIHTARLFADGGALSMADIRNGCCRSTDTDMGSKAVKINCVFGWDDIILPEHSKKLMKTACNQVRYRHRVYDTWGFSDKIAYGKSVSMIFTGPPGTGKTMAAQIIAAELGLDIYRISLANVVSKYIGETEKNLDEIFEKAKKSKVVLFFDEADVLFSKRTEVKDSNDKYSNMESAFLLQKIEEYNGIVILATNLVQNFDEAFKRRMKLMIDFPFPDAGRRAEMWKRAFPEKLPLDNIDFDYLVNNFELSGSNIKNIALHSAFLAAADGSCAVSMKHIIAALKNEYSKSGKAFTKADAGEYYRFIDE